MVNGITRIKSDDTIRIQNSIDFIENNLQNQITIYDIAQHACFSISYFQKKFHDYTGYSVKEYLRKRRLARSAEELVTKNLGVIDIAYNFDFGYEQSFIRAFKKEFGVTPGHFRRNKINISLTGKLDMVSGFLHSDPGIPKMVLHHEITVWGKEFEIDYEENLNESTAMKIKDRFLRNHMHQAASNGELHSFMESIPGNFQKGTFFLSFPEKDCEDIGRGLEKKKIPFHISASLGGFTPKHVKLMLCRDLEGLYRTLKTLYIPKLPYSEDESYSYTVMPLGQLSNSSSCYSVNIPIKKAV